MSEQRSWRPLLAICGLLGLVGVVAFAAAGRSPAGGDSRPSGHAPTLLVDYLATLALLMVPAGAVLLVWLAFARKGLEAQTGKQSRSGFVSAFALLLVLGALVAGRTHFNLNVLSRSEPDTAGGVTSPTGTTKKGGGGKALDEYRAHFRWLPLFVFGSLVLAFGGTAGAMVWRRRHGLLPDAPLAAVLDEVLAETLDDLRNEPDPRRAVIGAYAKMERTLAARGLPREPFEAPVEYLVRILDSVQASSHSVRRLTLLFERARFSPHEIDDRMKQDAIDALVGLRAELEVEQSSS